MADYSEKQIQEAWEKATPFDGLSPNDWRLDPCGAWIKRDQYGDANAQYGWNIDHIMPLSLFNKGGDFPENRWAMHCRNNASKSDSFPQFKAVLTSKGKDDVEETKKWWLAPPIIDRLLSKVNGLDSYIKSHINEWVKLYGQEQVSVWLKPR